jgi:class 3 adenylate cyclase
MPRTTLDDVPETVRDREQTAETARDREQAAQQAAKRLARLRAMAVTVDSRPGLLAFMRRLRQRLPGDEQFGDPLSTGGDTAVQVIARGVSALQPERPSVAKELGLAGLQVWQSLSEATGRGRGDRELAILFTDLVGFSSWALEAGDTATLELLRTVGLAIENAVTGRDGRIVKRLGDGVMATFLDAESAVDAALEAREALGTIDVGGYQPQMRAGIHWGRPRKLGGDYLGVDVNIAARVADAAKADEVLVSEALCERLALDRLVTTRHKRLKAEGTPRDLRVVAVSRV